MSASIACRIENKLWAATYQYDRSHRRSAPQQPPFPDRPPPDRRPLSETLTTERRRLVILSPPKKKEGESEACSADVPPYALWRGCGQERGQEQGQEGSVLWLLFETGAVRKKWFSHLFVGAFAGFCLSGRILSSALAPFTQRKHRHFLGKGAYNA